MLSGKKLGFDLCWGGNAKKEVAQGGLHGNKGNVGEEFAYGARFNGGMTVRGVVGGSLGGCLGPGRQQETRPLLPRA